MNNKILFKGLRRATSIPILIIFMIILVMPLSFADHDYLKAGDTLSDYLRGSGNFDSITAGIESRTLTNPVQLPLIADLDNNGDYEIITLSYGSLRLFRDKNLTAVKSITIDNNTYSNMIIFDIDGDDYQEIIIGLEENKTIRSYQYNGSTLIEDHTIDLAPIGANITTDGGEFLIGCRDPDECLLTWSQKVTGGVAQAFLYAVPFNSTNVNPVHYGFKTTLWINGVWCTPYIRDMTVINLDPESGIDSEYLFTYYTLETGTSTMRNYIFGIDVTAGTMSKFLDFYKDESDALVSGDKCEYLDRKALTPLTVADFEDGGDLEIVFAKSYNPVDFKIYAYDSIGNIKGTYPAAAYGTGDIISNVFVASSHDTGDDDFCVMGYSQTDSLIELVCGSLDNDPYGFLSSLFGAGTNVFYSADDFLDDNFNLTSSRVYSVLAHAGQHRTGQSIETSEIITSYGIFALDFSSLDCYTYSSCDLEQIYRNPKSEGAMISADPEQSGSEDLILLTENNLFYLDDTFSNSPIDYMSIDLDPCTNQGDGVWKINTSVKVYVNPRDPEHDLVAARVYLYHDTPNEQDSNWSSYNPEGTEFDFLFTANKTVTNGIIRVEARDIENPSSILFQEKTFSVALEGLEFGDCRETIKTYLELPDINDTIVEGEEFTATNNNLRDGVISASNDSGIPVAIFLMIIQFGLSVLILVVLWRVPHFAVILIVLVNIFFIVGTAIMQLYGTAFIQILVALVLIFGGFYLSKLFNSGVSNGGL